MFDKNSDSGMFSVKPFLGTGKSRMILSSFYRHNNNALWIVIRRTVITTINIMGTFSGQLLRRILLFKDVIIMNSSRIAFTCHKDFALRVYGNLRLEGMALFLARIVFLLYPLDRSLSLLFCGVAYRLGKLRAHYQQLFPRGDLLRFLRNPLFYRLTQRWIGGFFHQRFHLNSHAAGVAWMKTKNIPHEFIGEIKAIENEYQQKFILYGREFIFSALPKRMFSFSFG